MISLSNVAIGYGHRTQLSGLEFQIPGSGVTQLVGPSGVGKTTLLQVLSAIKMPLNGDVLIGDIKTSEMGYFQKLNIWKKELSFHFQINNVIPQESVLYNICFKRMVSKREVEQISAICNMVGLALPLKTKARNLSVGQRNRLSIVRSFYQDRKFVLLDEPLASLDSESQFKVIELINVMSVYRSIVIASHEQVECENVKQVIMLNDYVCEMAYPTKSSM